MPVIDCARVPKVGFGTAPLGGLYSEVSAQDAVESIGAALDLGYRYFDTAPLYGYGAAERAVGRALPGGDADVLVSTKVGRVIDEGASRPEGDMFAGSSGAAVWDFSAEGVRRSLEASLGRLARDFVDIVYIHDPDHHARQALDEAYPELECLRGEGVVGRIGVGMNEPDLAARFATETDIDTVLIAGRYTLLDQSAEEPLLRVAESRGIHVVAAGVYNSGVLTGAEEDPHFDYAAAGPEILARVERLRAVCDEFAVPLAAAAVQFTARHQAVGTVLLGARSPAEATQNWAHANTSLPGEVWPTLERCLVAERDVD